MEIYPVCNLGYDVYDEVVAILKRLGNVRLDGINKVRRKNNHAVLFVDQNNQRQEILRNRVPTLSFDQVRPFLDGDAVLVNFISGFDIGLPDLKRVRRNTSALILMDVHSLTLGIRKDGERFFKAPRLWRDYVKQADILQSNLAELSVLSGKNLASLREIRDFGDYILSLGPNVLLVTMGEDGAVMFCKVGRTRSSKRCEGIQIRRFKDATGCGDVFSAGFLACYLRTRDLDQSLDFANRVAAEKCKVSGVESVARLLKKLAIVRSA